MRTLAVTSLCLVLAACGTKYQEIGLTGGVAAEQITHDTFRIVARGNGYTDQRMVQDYTLLKAAETTEGAGFTHFTIISAADATRANTVVTAGPSTTTMVGRTAITTPGAVSADTIIKPGSDTYIRVFNLSAGQQPAPGTYSASEIITYIGPRVKRG